MNNYKVYVITRKEMEKRNYEIIEVLNVYDDCVEYLVETPCGYKRVARVYD